MTTDEFMSEIFQSTPPVWAETFLWTIYKRRILFQSTPPVWAESIHSARVGGDRPSAESALHGADFNPLRPCGRRQSRWQTWSIADQISIHSARVGGDNHVGKHGQQQIKFQSTPPVWAETQRSSPPAYPCPSFQSTPPVWAETSLRLHYTKIKIISIHSARVGGDQRHANIYRWQYDISIHSARVGGDVFMDDLQKAHPISIHSARVGGGKTLDYFNPLRPCGRRHAVWSLCQGDYDFNPLRPCGRRRETIAVNDLPTGFQSTPPVWAETQVQEDIANFSFISIHSARVGGDGLPIQCRLSCSDFNPLRPCGRRRALLLLLDSYLKISIHSARVGGD